MEGAGKYAKLFKTGQYGRFFISSDYHARGRTFSIWVLPKGEIVLPGKFPSAKAVKVYGVTGGFCGWTETYGWLHEGKWVEDFQKMVAKRAKEVKAEKTEFIKNQEIMELERNKQTEEVLKHYERVD